MDILLFYRILRPIVAFHKNAADLKTIVATAGRLRKIAAGAADRWGHGCSRLNMVLNQGSATQLTLLSGQLGVVHKAGSWVDGKPLAALAADNGFHQSCMGRMLRVRMRLATPCGSTSVARAGNYGRFLGRYRGIHRSAAFVAGLRSR